MFQKTDPIGLSRLLGVGDERDCEKGASKHADERAPIHWRITMLTRGSPSILCLAAGRHPRKAASARVCQMSGGFGDDWLSTSTGCSWQPWDIGTGEPIP